MSEYQQTIGKIKRVEFLENETFKDVCKRLWLENGEDVFSYEEHILFDEYYNKYFKVKNSIWEIINQKDNGRGLDYCNLTKNEDSSYNFNTNYYNGGTCAIEMLQDEIINQNLHV